MHHGYSSRNSVTAGGRAASDHQVRGLQEVGSHLFRAADIREYPAGAGWAPAHTDLMARHWVKNLNTRSPTVEQQIAASPTRDGVYLANSARATVEWSRDPLADDAANGRSAGLGVAVVPVGRWTSTFTCVGNGNVGRCRKWHLSACDQSFSGAICAPVTSRRIPICQRLNKGARSAGYSQLGRRCMRRFVRPFRRWPA